MKTKSFYSFFISLFLLSLLSCGSKHTRPTKHKKVKPLVTQKKSSRKSKSSLSRKPLKRTKTLSSTSVQVNSDVEFYGRYSLKLDIMLTGSEHKKLIKTVASWKGSPYLYGGTVKTGVDCSGFVGAVYQEVYNKKLHRRSRDMLLDVKIIKKSQLQTGDLVFFKTGGKKYVSHVGIYIANNKFIHAASRGVVVNDLDDTYYKKAYYKSGRVK